MVCVGTIPDHVKASQALPGPRRGEVFNMVDGRDGLRRAILQVQMEDSLSRDDYLYDFADLYKHADDAYRIQTLLSINMLMLLGAAPVSPTSRVPPLISP